MELTTIQLKILHELINSEPFENNNVGLIVLNEAHYPYSIDNELLFLEKENLIERLSWNKRICNHKDAWALDMQEFKKIYGYRITSKGNFEYAQHTEKLKESDTILSLSVRNTVAQETCASEAEKTTGISDKANKISIISAAFAAIALVISIIAIVIQLI